MHRAGESAPTDIHNTHTQRHTYTPTYSPVFVPNRNATSEISTNKYKKARKQTKMKNKNSMNYNQMR